MLEFCALVLCLAAFLSLLSSPIAPWAVYLHFSILGIMSSPNGDSLASVSLLYKNQHKMDPGFKFKPLNYEVTRIKYKGNTLRSGISDDFENMTSKVWGKYKRGIILN